MREAQATFNCHIHSTNDFQHVAFTKFKIFSVRVLTLNEEVKFIIVNVTYLFSQRGKVIDYLLRRT